MGPTASALLGLATWSLLLLGMIAGVRVSAVLTGKKKGNDFEVFGDDVSPFSNRLCRYLYNI